MLELNNPFVGFGLLMAPRVRTDLSLQCTAVFEASWSPAASQSGWRNKEIETLNYS